MANIFEIPKANPIRFYHQSDITLNTASGSILLNVFNPSHNYKTWDSDFFYRVLKAWQDKTVYFTPFQQCDPIIFQFSGSDTTTSNYVVRILDCEGRTYSTELITQISGTFSGLKVYECKIKTNRIPPGVYFIQVQHLQTGADVFMLSEPVEIKQIHDKTFQAIYTNSYNRGNVKFNNDIQFVARFEGFISEVVNDADFNIYEDQPKNAELISGKTFKTCTLQVTNVPEYRIELLNEITMMDTFIIDGKYYTRAENAKFERRGNEHNELKTYTIQLRERYNEDSLEVDEFEVKSVATLPTTDLFYIKSITIGGSIITMEYDFTGARNFVDYLNNVILTQGVSLTGFFSVSEDGSMYYKRGRGETISGTFSLSSANVLPYGLELEVSAEPSADTLGFTISDSGTNSYAVVWGDGTQVNLTSFTTSVTPSKAYTTKKKYTARVFTSDIDSGVDFSSTSASITEISGIISPLCDSITLSSKGLKQIKSSLFYSHSVAATLDFTGNNLSTKAVNSYLRLLHKDIEELYTGTTIDVSLQAVSAPPADTTGMRSIIEDINNVITITTD